ncbi:MAG: GIY-YIG nuclease family protein [Candidatus Magasanikbacteria bacterium]|nr:GIY-YIG nuclease family protein [Candidatus Magasanikbacteria bacterium]
MKASIDLISQLPDRPGIYLFYTEEKELVYVGKATSLKNRVRSYFAGKKTSRPIEQMMHVVVDIKWIETDSVLEAVILEANYIQKHLPKYNVDGKDNKSWNYIVITKDVYPKVKTVRHHEMKQLSASEQKTKFLYIFGPYPGLNTQATLKLLRELFTFSTCEPGAKRPCLYYQMQQCLGVCTGEISVTDYKKRVIAPLVTLLKGGKKRLLATLLRRMKDASRTHAYEEAARLRDQVFKLQRIHDIALLNKSFFDSDLSNDAEGGFQVVRIEGYDISNLGSSGKVGSMVVFEHGTEKKSDYRKFKIKHVEGQSDVDCLAEVLQRRIQHTEWSFPDIWLIDGGLPQVHTAEKMLREQGIDTPIIGIAKGAARKRNDFIIRARLRPPSPDGFGSTTPGKLKLGTRHNDESDIDQDVVRWVAANQDVLIRVRDEAHRFAITYQRSLRKML